MAIAIDHAAIFFTIVEAHLARSSSSSTAAAPSFGPDGPELGFDATQDAITGLKGWKLAVAPFSPLLDPCLVVYSMDLRGQTSDGFGP